MELLDALVSKIATAISVLYWEMKYVYSKLKYGQHAWSPPGPRTRMVTAMVDGKSTRMVTAQIEYVGRSKYAGWEINTHGHRPALEHMTSTVTINDAQTFELSTGV
jgi:hypothetical protein